MQFKTYLFVLINLLIISNSTVAQINKKALIGAWQSEFKDDQGNEYLGIGIITDGYFSVAKFNIEDQKFISTLGGSWKLEGNKMIETIEYNTAENESVGNIITSEIEVDKDNLTFLGIGEIWTRMDDGNSGDLAGAWVITGRERDGEMTTRTPGPRITMKILSGTRFQWIAYNTETRQFMGTGGGTYSTIDGKYTENIDFFSKDGSRVGASLTFEFEIKDGNWHHKGLSSKGDAIYEIWSLR